jgi:nuclear protein localization family protein 4
LIVCRHGDIIYITYVRPEEEETKPNNSNSNALISVKQDAVDDFLEKQRGLIDRKKDLKL